MSARIKIDPTHQRNQYIAAISVMQKQLGMDRETLQQLCVTVTGKPSRRDMSNPQLLAVRQAMVQRGGKLTKGKNTALGAAQHMGKQAAKLRALWQYGFDLGIINNGSESALASWAANSRAENVVALLANFGVDDYIANIERLKKWLYREVLAGKLTCPNGHDYPIIPAVAAQIVNTQAQHICPLCEADLAWSKRACPPT